MIQTNNSPNFRAKLWTYPPAINNPEVFKKFEAKTSNYPNLILKQDDISFLKEDSFFLLDEKGKVLKFDTASFTNNHPETLDGVVERFVSIFNKLLKASKHC